MRSRLSLRVCAAMLLAGMLAAGCASSRPALATADSVTAAKISPMLQAAVQQLQNGTALRAHGPVRSDAQGRIQIYVHVGNTSSETISTLINNGLQEIEISPAMNIVQGWVKPSNLVNLAALPFVIRITPPQYAQPR